MVFCDQARSFPLGYFELMVMQLSLPVVIEGKRHVSELVEVEQIEGARFKIVCPPTMVEGLASGDVIEVDEQQVAGFKVVEHSGLITIWLFFESAKQRDENTANPLFEELLMPLDGRLDSLAKQSAIFSIPVSAGFHAIEQVFDRLCASLPGAGWMYGNVWGGDNQPLNWWNRR